MKITIEKGKFTKAIVTDTDGVRIPCLTEAEIMREVRIFLSEMKVKK
jgi:hypothetical protein